MLEKAKVTDLAQLAHIAEEEFMEVGCKLIHARRVIELANRVVYRSLSDTKELARTQELAVAGRGGAWDDGAYSNHHQVRARNITTLSKLMNIQPNYRQN